MSGLVIHACMCPQCGKETLPIVRMPKQHREKFHRKWLYCPWCQQTVNTYECRNQEEKEEFKRLFASGVITAQQNIEMSTPEAKKEFRLHNANVSAGK